MKDISRLFSFERVLFFQRIAISALIALILLSSLLPLFSVPFDDDFSQFYVVLDDEEEISYKEKMVYVDFDFSGSVLSLFKMIEFSGANASLYYDSYHAINDCKDGHSLSLRGTAIAYLILEAYDNDFSAGIYFTIMLLVTLAIPILAAICVILIIKDSGEIRRLWSQTSDEYSVYRSVMRKFRRILLLVPFPIMLVAIASKVSFGPGAIALFVFAGLGVLLNAVAPRFKAYTKVQKKYYSMLQIVSLLGIAIFITFCVTLVRSETVSKAIGLFDNKSLSQFFALFKGGNFDISHIIAIISGLVFSVGLLGIHHSLSNNLCRLGLTTTRMKKRDYSRGDDYIGTTIRPNLMIAIYLLLLNSPSELVFYKEQIPAFIICMSCVVLMTLTEIAVRVLGETLCGDLGRGGKDTVLEGTIYEAQIEKYSPVKVAKKASGTKFEENINKN